MSPDVHGFSIGSQDSGDADVFAGLWEQAAFPRLPQDAPPELKDLVEDVENPKRVYTIHRASRRHNFQLLVQKFVIQLRDGCGSTNCNTPSCFSCRKRIVGRAPLRRYNTTSARTIAVFLASQDNPENGLCPSLRSPKGPPAALASLIFATKPPNRAHPREGLYGHGRSGQNGRAPGPPLKIMPNGIAPPASGSPRCDKKQSRHGDGVVSDGPLCQRTCDSAADRDGFKMTERPVNKDYRSFAANMFGTVAFKMLEWLTPASLDEMARKASEFHGERSTPESSAHDSSKSSPPNDQIRADSPSFCGAATGVNGHSPATNHRVNGRNQAPGSPPDRSGRAQPETRETEANRDKATAEKPYASTNSNGHSGHSHSTAPRSGNTRRNSNARVRTQASTRPKRTLSIDNFPPDQSQIQTSQDEVLSALKSPRAPTMPSLAQDKHSRAPLKPTASTHPRPISQLSSAGIFDGVPIEKMPPPKATVTDQRPTKTGRSQLDGSHTNGTEKAGRTTLVSEVSSSEDTSQGQASPCDFDAAFDFAYNGFLPQTVSRLSPELVDFFCDVLQDDFTAETHLLEPSMISRHHPVREGVSKRRRPLARVRLPSPGPYSADMRYRWMLFIEQSLFYVLSDPRRLIKSFTRKGQLFDSHTLWYCMLRMSRVAPTVVIHSLWLAAEALFTPPKSVQSLRSPTARLFPKHENSLSNAEAGIVLSICLHLLIAIAPVAFKKEELHDMSRIRSHGLILARTGAVARQSSKLCLAYNDALSNDLALRLARRLFAAITTRRYFDEMTALDMSCLSNSSTSSEDRVSVEPPDALTPLFQQLDFLNADTAYIMCFSIPNRAIHEIRAPTLLLDWARNVMLQEWDGRPEVPGDGPFGGALALIKTMHQKRRLLVLADGQFRAEYFADRLDDVEMPVSWLTFTSTKQKVHLLDYPYIFSSSNLVSYFRSINFSRMSRYFEESSSVQSRMEAMIRPNGSLVANSHHKHVLQDMLKAASAKYLVLKISRDNVLEDAFNQLWRREERELFRPLKVRLGEGEGEEGFDSGGVQQEFFRLAVAEALNPDFGAFTVDERTRMTWFNPVSPEPDWKFELVGLLFSLAVYNGLTLPVTFPSALYCKLLGEPVTELHHIADGWPDLASGLTTLIEWDEKDGMVEDVFARTYEFSVSAFGQPVSREMRTGKQKKKRMCEDEDGSEIDHDEDYWPEFPGKKTFGGSPSSLRPLHDGNPGDAPLVTRENRNAYVSDYVHYLTDVSVRPQYEAFERGFRTCLNAKSLTLLTPKLLQSVVEGVQEIDMAELRRYARYVGWDASHRTVRDFWSVVRRFDNAMRQKLLEFVTASDRVPVGGMKNIQFVIQRNGEEEGDGGHLPTAYTCYGTLLLPQYRDREVLRERLSMALENSQGFGFA